MERTSTPSNSARKSRLESSRRRFSAEGNDGAFTETADQMVRYVCRELGSKKNIIVFNDEAHHCYRRKPDGEDVHLFKHIALTARHS